MADATPGVQKGLTIAGRTFGSRLIMGTGGAANLTVLETTTPAPKTSAKPPPQPGNRYSKHRSQVGNFAEQKWGISLSLVICFVIE